MKKGQAFAKNAMDGGTWMGNWQETQKVIWGFAVFDVGGYDHSPTFTSSKKNLNNYFMKTGLLKVKKIFWLMLVSLALVSSGCVTVFSDMQSARLVGKGKFEATPGYSSVSSNFEDEKGKVQDEVGVQLAYGISEKIDIRFRYEYVEGTSIIGFGPKISLLKDRIALYTPLGFAVGEEDTWEFQPTMLFTVPIVPSKLDFNPSLKYIIPFCEECENLVAVNAGLAISNDISKWALRPEYGMLFNPGENGHYAHFSVGVSVNFSNLKK